MKIKHCPEWAHEIYINSPIGRDGQECLGLSTEEWVALGQDTRKCIVSQLVWEDNLVNKLTDENDE